MAGSGRKVASGLLVAGIAVWPTVASAQWKTVEQVKTYAIGGRDGAALYASIGERGPGAGDGGRAIAHTSFKLTWSRKYVPQGDACVLVSARPKLTITTTLPKPTDPLPASVQKKWSRFLAGVTAHERVHGDQIEAMVTAIEAASVGSTVQGDPDCRKIRAELTKRLAALSQAQRQQSRDFDRTELSTGGNVQRLILELVNGP